MSSLCCGKNSGVYDVQITQYIFLIVRDNAPDNNIKGSQSIPFPTSVANVYLLAIETK